MLIPNSGGLQCLAFSLFFALFTICAQATWSPTSFGTSMSSVTPPYGNTTSTTPTSSINTSSPKSMTTPTDIGSSMPTTEVTGTPIPIDFGSSMTMPTVSGTTSPTYTGRFTPTTNGTSTSPPTESTISTPTTSMTETPTVSFGNSATTSLASTISSDSVPTSSVANTRTFSSENGTSPSSSPTGSIIGNSSSMMTTLSPIPNPTGTATGTWSTLAGGSTATLLANIGSFKYQGCAASASNFSGFTLVDKSPIMTLDMCVTECGATKYTYAGIQSTNCYCANSLTSDVTVIPGQGSCTIPCPGNPLEFCGGTMSSAKRGLKRQAQGGFLLSLFANTPAGRNSLNPTFSNTPATSPTFINSTSTIPSPTSTAGIPATNMPPSSGPSNSTTPMGSGNFSPTMSTTGGVMAHFTNGTSPGSRGPPSVSPTVISTTTSSALFGNGSTTTSPSSSPTKPLNSTTITSPGNSGSPSVSTGVPTSSSLPGSRIISFAPTSGSSTSPNNSVGFTITEIIYTTTTYCPVTISTTISGTPTYIITNSVSTIVLTSTIIVPCHKCLEPSQMITLSPAINTSGPYQSLSLLPSTMNEIIVTEIIYTTVSTCPITTGTGIFSGSTSYYVTNTASTLILTATTTVPCQNCHPKYATVTVMLIGASPTGSSENIAGISQAPSPSSALSNQQSTNGVGQADCPSCGGALNVNVGTESMGGAIIVAFSPAGPPNAAQTSVQGSINGGAQSTVPAGSSVIATSTPILHGPYLTSSSKRSLEGFTQTMVLGLVFVAGVGMALL